MRARETVGGEFKLRVIGKEKGMEGMIQGGGWAKEDKMPS